ncbi:MAG: M48 family metallopeptidase [Candidatus Aenigmatarchaeota archaeon]
MKDKRILIFKRKVKYLRLEVDLESIKIIAPVGVEINEKEILERHKKWIEKRIERLNEIKRIAEGLEIYKQENLYNLVEVFIDEISKILNVKPEKILFRKMKKRWGSCNYRKKILIFNKNLEYLPEELIKHIVIHEMCHLIVRNHNKEFCALVSKLDPDFKEKRKMLAGYMMKFSKR